MFLVIGPLMNVIAGWKRFEKFAERGGQVQEGHEIIVEGFVELHYHINNRTNVIKRTI